MDFSGRVFEGIREDSSTNPQEQLETIIPVIVLLTTAVGSFTVGYFARYFSHRNEESWSDYLARWALRVPYIRNRYQIEINTRLTKMKQEVAEKWNTLGIPITKLPEKGLSFEELSVQINAFAKATTNGIANQHLSGTVYQKAMQSNEEPIYTIGIVDPSEADNDEVYFEKLMTKLEALYTQGFTKSFLWNPLHSHEFPVGPFVEYQVVRMVAEMFGGRPDEVHGFITSGGSESLMLSVRAYMIYGMEKKGLNRGDCVIIAGDSVHAAVIKCKDAFGVKVVLVKTDSEGRIQIDALKEALQTFGSHVVAIYGSAPSYMTGVIDPIEDMAALAQEHGCGMHVDCCLGGFVVNNLGIGTNFLQLPGVTSLSADTHKNGLAAKGSSVCVMKELHDRNLSEYASYVVANWEGGLYGTPRDPGSVSSVPALNAYLALLGTGTSGYYRMANAIHTRAVELANLIRQFDDLALVAEVEANVVAFKMKDENRLGKGAIYAFSHKMSSEGITLNNLAGDRVHFCVTLRGALSPNLLNDFKQAIQMSLLEVKEMHRNKTTFPGDAGLYCTLDNYLAPELRNLSLSKYLENRLLGKKGVKDGVRSHFSALQDPYSNQV